jgi:hypothetical protein
MRKSLADQLAELAKMKDEDIDTSDIPETTEEWWADARLERRQRLFEQNQKQ